MDEETGKRDLPTWRAYLAETRASGKVFAWVWREFVDAPTKRLVKIVVIGIVLASAAGAAEAYGFAKVLDGLTAKSFAAIASGFGLVAVMKAIGKILHWWHGKNREQATGAINERLESRLTELFFEKSLGQHLSESGTLSAANIDKGRNYVANLLQFLAFDGGTTVLELFVALAFIVWLSLVSATIVSGLFLVYTAWMVHLNWKCQDVTPPIYAEWRAINRMRVERWDNIERVKTNGKEARELAILDARTHEVTVRERAFWFWFIDMMFRRDLMNDAFVIAAAAFGAYQVYIGAWTIGLFIPLYTWTSFISNNIWRIGQLEHRINEALPSVRALMDAMTLPPEATDAPDAIEIDESRPLRVEFYGVSHAYREKERGDRKAQHVLKNVSFTIEPREKVAMIGVSGAGKTTIMRLLQRYSDPDHGAILVNGVDLRRVKRASWIRQLGYIPQNAMVLDGTIRYNLLYGLTVEEAARISDERLWEIMRLLKIDFGERLTDGLDTKVGRRGIKLSGGQAQRLMIGAAVLRRPRLLIVDEATSSLDSTTERAVQQGLAELLPPESSAFIITHRLSTVRGLCSKFLVLLPTEELVNGSPQIEATAGSFEELRELSPTFRRLAEDQGIATAQIAA